MSRVLIPAGIGLLAFVVGASVAVFGTIALAEAVRGSTFVGREVLLFKGVYSGIIIGSIALTAVLSWWAARRWGQLPSLSTFVGPFLLGLTLAWWAPLSSYVNDCAVGIEFPFPVIPCD